MLRKLHRQLWVPLVSALPAHASQAILCPDAQLNFLSFATLLDSSNRFLGEEYLVSYVSSGRDLLAETPPASSSPELLVWANPDFGTSSGGPLPVKPRAEDDSPASGRELRGLDFRPLPGAEQEGRWLYDHAKEIGFARSTLHVGQDATERELIRVRAPQAIHFATHGFLLPESDFASPPLGRAGGASAVRNTLSRVSNPMLRSGLALAGARHTLDAWSRGESIPANDDGIVTSEEIGCLNLHGTELVVLSACDTGLGEPQTGEGVLGLRRGFLQAGAQNVLLTLWPIDDRQTSGFMPELYKATHRIGSSAQALAEVQRSWLKKLRTQKGFSEACIIAGPFILSSQGKPYPQDDRVAANR